MFGGEAQLTGEINELPMRFTQSVSQSVTMPTHAVSFICAPMREYISVPLIILYGAQNEHFVHCKQLHFASYIIIITITQNVYFNTKILSFPMIIKSLNRDP